MKIGLRLLEKFRFGDNKFLHHSAACGGVFPWMEKFIVYKAMCSKSVRTYSELNFIPKDLTLDFIKISMGSIRGAGQK